MSKRSPMSYSGSGRFFELPDERDAEQAKQSKNKNSAGDGPGSSAPTESNRTHAFVREDFSLTDGRRTDLRTVDCHASWREVADASHVEPGR
jgi:hypothetical protein